MRISCFATACLIALSATEVAADTLVVGPVGSGAPYQVVQEAIDAAAPGDTVRVLAIEVWENLVVDKPLNLVGDGSAVVRVGAPVNGPGFTTDPALWVTGIEAGQSVRVSGISLRGSGLLFGVGGVLFASDCAGSLTFSEVEVFTQQSAPAPLGLIQVFDCDQVLFSDCTVLQEAGTSTQRGQSALKVVDSSVWVNDCELSGRHGGLATGPGHADAGPAVEIDGGSLRVGASRLVGGTGGSALFTDDPPTGGGPAILATGAVVRLQGGPGNLLVGGDGGSNGSGASGAGASGIVLASGANITIPSDVAVEPGTDGDGGLTAQPVTLLGESTAVPVDLLTTLRAQESQVAPGSTLLLDAAGASGAAVVPLVSLKTLPALNLPGFYGDWLLGLPFFVLPGSLLDGTGAATFAVPLPADPGLVGVFLYFQSAEIGALDGLSVPTVVALRD